MYDEVEAKFLFVVKKTFNLISMFTYRSLRKKTSVQRVMPYYLSLGGILLRVVGYGDVKLNVTFGYYCANQRPICCRNNKFFCFTVGKS